MQLGEVHAGKCYIVIGIVWVLTYVKAGSQAEIYLI